MPIRGVDICCLSSGFNLPTAHSKVEPDRHYNPVPDYWFNCFYDRQIHFFMVDDWTPIQVGPEKVDRRQTDHSWRNTRQSENWNVVSYPENVRLQGRQGIAHSFAPHFRSACTTASEAGKNID